ncbi:probable G-protein coupled receptor Mth-like 3 [Tigriopus californicus]|nr:probable G-protein coupled receptor Mth-like 3 [Tigriopus californicus]
MDLAPLPKQYTWMKPKIGLVSCWFAGDLAIVLYFYGPIGTMLLANVTLFVRVATAFSSLVQETVVLRKYSSATTKSTLRKHVSNSSHDQQVHLLRVRLILGLKLFCVMGLSWTFEIISWILSTSTPCWMWYVPDAINLLQGLWIFLIFGAKPKRLAEIFHKIFKTSCPIMQVPPSLVPVPVHPE